MKKYRILKRIYSTGGTKWVVQKRLGFFGIHFWSDISLELYSLDVAKTIYNNLIKQDKCYLLEEEVEDI